LNKWELDISIQASLLNSLHSERMSLKVEPGQEVAITTSCQPSRKSPQSDNPEPFLEQPLALDLMELQIGVRIA